MWWYFVVLLMSDAAEVRETNWGFYAHGLINRTAVYLLPPEMASFYRKHIDYLQEHATDPDKRRYAVVEEGPRHYIDLDHYPPHQPPPISWKEAVEAFGEDTLNAHGIVPWHVIRMQNRLKQAFIDHDVSAILKNSAEIGHYIADAHVPLHTSSNHNGQLTNQRGIHGFWESRVPELLAEKEFNFLIGRAVYIPRIDSFIWQRVLESVAAVDSVLLFERQLTDSFPESQKFAFEDRNGKTVKQYSTAFTMAYDSKLNGMVERRMRASIFAVASFWHTAWVDAGQPDLSILSVKNETKEDKQYFIWLNKVWQSGKRMIGREE